MHRLPWNDISLGKADNSEVFPLGLTGLTVLSRDALIPPIAELTEVLPRLTRLASLHLAATGFTYCGGCIDFWLMHSVLTLSIADISLS